MRRYVAVGLVTTMAGLIIALWLEFRIESLTQSEVRRVITGMIEPARFNLGTDVHMWNCGDPVYREAAGSGKYAHTYCYQESNKTVYIDGVASGTR